MYRGETVRIFCGVANCSIFHEAKSPEFKVTYVSCDFNSKSRHYLGKSFFSLLFGNLLELK